jgi:hypothetical protein
LGLAALNLLQDVGPSAPGGPDLQDFCPPLFSRLFCLQGAELGRMELYGVVYASPLVLEILDLSFEVGDAVWVYGSYVDFLIFLAIYGT